MTAPLAGRARAMSCGPGPLLDVTTEVFSDGSVRRRVEVVGFPGPGESDGSRVENLVVAADNPARRTVEDISTPTRSYLLVETPEAVSYSSPASSKVERPGVARRAKGRSRYFPRAAVPRRGPSRRRESPFG